MQFKVEEVKLVLREPGARRTIPVLRVHCLFPKAGSTAKPTLVFTARVRPVVALYPVPGATYH